MIQKIISNLVFILYNLINRNQLFLLNKKVKDKHSSIDQSRSIEIETYCMKWDINSPFESISLMVKEDVKKWIVKVDESQIKSWAYTGGSYGEPLRVPYSRKRNLIRTATFKYFNEIAGYQLGDPFVLIRAKNKSPLLKFLRNETIFIPRDISEPRMESFLRELKRKQIKVLMGYPTVIYELALFLQQNLSKKKGLRIKSIITVSEPLEDFKRQIIHDVFQCNFVDRYSNEEVGLIAQQKEFGGEYFVNRFGVYVEVVNPASLLPVKEGEQGKVVVTDVFNDLIPVIRYDTGDLATAHKYQDGQLLSIRNIIGRVTEQIKDVSGKSVSPLMLGPFIYKPLSRQGKVFQYQFAQTGISNYELRIKAKEAELPETLKKEMIQSLQETLGIGAEVTLIHVEDIKPQPSGKRPVFKNEMPEQEK